MPLMVITLQLDENRIPIYLVSQNGHVPTGIGVSINCENKDSSVIFSAVLCRGHRIGIKIILAV